MKRRDFLKSIALTVAALHAVPVRAILPPRLPFVRVDSPRLGLMGLVSHLGVLPITRELSICEGVVLEIGDWDGMGYPCLVENACCFGPDRPRAWIYDFDLWNFREDDNLRPIWKHVDYKNYPNHAAFYADRRFGKDFEAVVRKGNGPLLRQLISHNYQFQKA